MTNKTINSYDIIGLAVLQYRNDLLSKGQLIDVDYIVTFEQSFYCHKEYEKCCEIVSLNMDNELTFYGDFCEGEQYVKNIKVRTLYEVGELIRKDEVYK